MLALAIAAIGCGGSGTREESLGPVAFEVPTKWERTDTHGRGTATAMFAPVANANKESVAVVRTELGPIVEKYTPEMLSSLLLSAQSSFPRSKTSPVARFTTERGFAGMRVEVEYVPPGRSERYHRVHALLVDGTALIHVMYTAATPDAELVVFQRVVDTLREES